MGYTVTEPAHAVYAPSAAHRWTQCTASAEALAKLDNFDHLYGDGENEIGTQAHDEIERCLGQVYDSNGNAAHRVSLPVNPEHDAAYGIALLLDYVRKLPPGQVWVEKRIRLTDKIWGRCDVAHWDESSATVTIVDYKNGFIDVQAKYNEQLRIYGAGSIFTHNLPAKWIRYAVVQPNSFLPVPRVKQWIESAADLYAFAQRTAAIPNGPLKFKTGEHCRYCPLFGRCPVSRDVLAQFQIAMAYTPDKIPADMVAIFKACEKPIEDWFKSLNKHWLKRALAGTVPPGTKLVQTQKHRAWISEDQARMFVVAKVGVNALSPPTPAQAEKLGLDVTDLVDRSEGGAALAFENDSRPVWKPKSVEKMFAGALGK